MPCALVIGGSVGGLMAANLLRTIGWEATVFERTGGDLSTRGAGIGATQELVDVMRRIGARFDASAGIANQSYVWMAADGSTLFAFERASRSSAWQRVYQPLRNVTPASTYRPGMRLDRVEQDDSSVTAIFNDGSRITGDLLIAADGALSTVRAQYLPDIVPHYANYVAWRGLAEERDLPSWAREAIAGRVVFCFPDGEQVLTMAVPGADEDVRPGFRRFYIIWYRPADAMRLSQLFTDINGRHHSLAIPPPLIRPDFIAELRADAERVLPPAVREVLRAVPHLLLQAITDLECPRITFGRVAIMGDAAFVARPHSVAGVSKAALDAQCLVEELAQSGGDIPTALVAYNTRRTDFGRRLVAHARYLGAHIEGRSKPDSARTAQERQRDPAQIIRDYGAPHLLHDVGVAV